DERSEPRRALRAAFARLFPRRRGRSAPRRASHGRDRGHPSATHPPGAALIAKAEQKYLERYAEPEARLAERLGAFGHAVVVPACGEGELLIEMLRSVPRGSLGEVLVVLVVNGKRSSAEWVHEENRAVLARLRRAFGDRKEDVLSTDPPAHLLSFGPGRILLL